ncbi:MAG: response regulator [Lachnospiraceae bacterium]|nr:response regulator [Lachnospiraceae bacterium]
MARLMLCDDALFMRSAIKKMVEDAKHSVVAEVGNGREAVEMYQVVRPDIVLMDITMPEMDGITATKEIIKFDPDAKIIIVSALGQMEMVIKAITAGAKDFIVKPIEGDKLQFCIRKYM